MYTCSNIQIYISIHRLSTTMIANTCNIVFANTPRRSAHAESRDTLALLWVFAKKIFWVPAEKTCWVFATKIFRVLVKSI